MRQITDTVLDMLDGADGLRWTAWAITVLSVAVGLGAAALFPTASLAAYGAALVVILYVWDAYYDDLIQMAHDLQEPETIGARAVIVRLRIAACGALMFVAIGLLLMQGLGRTLDPGMFAAANIAIALSVPLSLFVLPVQRFYLDALKFGINLPFQVAFLALGVLRPRAALLADHRQVNAVARKVFGAVTGYPSRLTFLMKTDDILRGLPTRQ